MIIDNIIQTTEERMKNCTELFKTQIQKINTGRISPNILDNIQISYHDKKKEITTPLRYLSSIITKDARTLIITVFDNTIIHKIEKAISKSDLILNTKLHDNKIYVYSPTLTETYRKHLIKLIHTEAEKTKISIRNIRRAINEKIKILMKNKTISADKEHYLQNKVQLSTNIWIKKINKLTHNKETELKNI